MDIPLVLSNYYKGQAWVLTGDTHDGLEWNKNNTLPKPALEELSEKWNELLSVQQWKELRKERNKRITQTDYLAIPDYPHATEEVKQAWLDYRQALRDLPANTTDPENPVWPEAPN